jgi:Uma2 family endonuclease
MAFRITRYAKERGLGKVFIGDAGVFMQRDPDTVRGPDVLFVRTSRLPPREALKSYFEIPPDLCVEVVSPTDRWSKITEKVDMFLAFGVILVWVIDPQTRTAHVYRKGREVRVVLSTESLDGEDVLPGFALPLAELFG